MNLTENLIATGYISERGVFTYHQPIRHITYQENYNGYYKKKDSIYEKQLSALQKDTKADSIQISLKTKGS